MEKFTRRPFHGLEDIRPLARMELYQLVERELCAHVPEAAYHETVEILRLHVRAMAQTCVMAEVAVARAREGR